MAIVRQSVLIAIVAARKIAARWMWPVCAAMWFLCAASVAFNTTAHAVTEHTPYPEGAPGDHDTVSVCEEGSYLVGFRARLGRWIDKIGIICDRRDPSGSDFGDTSTHPMFGGNGGGEPAEYRCNSGEFITGLSVWRTAPAQEVQVITGQCSAGAGTHELWVGDKVDIFGHNRDQPCGAGEVGRGLKIRWGQYVNAIGLHCDKPDPPRAATQDFDGYWRVQASNGATWDVELTLTGKQVTGGFTISGQPQFSGALSGNEVANGAIRFAWTQPQVPAEGQGWFEVFTNGTFRGYLDHLKPSLAHIRWSGSGHRVHTTGQVATVVQATTAYKEPTGDGRPENIVCYMLPGNTGIVVGTKPPNWINLSNISSSCAGQSGSDCCNGKSGWVWNEGELRLP